MFDPRTSTELHIMLYRTPFLHTFFHLHLSFPSYGLVPSLFFDSPHPAGPPCSIRFLFLISISLDNRAVHFFCSMYRLAFASLVALAACSPQRGRAKQQTAQQQAAQIPQGVSQATDGSMILDATVNVNQLPIRFKIAAPADQFTAASGVPGAAATAGANGTLGMSCRRRHLPI